MGDRVGRDAGFHQFGATGSAFAECGAHDRQDLIFSQFLAVVIDQQVIRHEVGIDLPYAFALFQCLDDCRA